MLLINICFSVLEDEGYHDLWACFVFVPGLSNIHSDFCLLQRLDWSSSSSASAQKDCILLAACEAHQSLPQSAEFPADLFTACLTTPIKMALHWFSFSLSLPLSSLFVHGYLCGQFLISYSPFLSMLCLHGDIPINLAGFVSDHYSVILWIFLLLTKFLEGKMTVKLFLGSSIGFLLL